MFTIIHPDYTIILKVTESNTVTTSYFFSKTTVTCENWEKVMNNICISTVLLHLSPLKEAWVISVLK